MPTLDLVPARFEDYRRLAEKRLPRMLFDYLDGGAYSESTLAANTEAFQKRALKQRVMRDVSRIDTGIELFGQKLAMPLVLAPIGLAGMMARRAEVQAVCAADTAGAAFCLSTVGICPVEEVAEAASKSFWFQLYMMRDRGYVTALLDRAKAAGCKTLVFTVDLAVLGMRYRDVRNGMMGGLSGWGKLRAALEYPLHPAWLWDVPVKGKPLTFGNLSALVPGANAIPQFQKWIHAQIDPSVTWKDIEWVRSVWEGDLVIKGVMVPEDARSAASAGASGIVVSNHGGRQLDGVPAAIDVVARMRDAVGPDMKLLMDGGVRTGQDVVRAVACGADAVQIGRPWIMALAARGQAGLESYLKAVQDEMKVSMALTATTRISELTADVLE